nr:hypothetical protein [Zoogloeaceae bacterium]
MANALSGFVDPENPQLGAAVKHESKPVGKQGRIFKILKIKDLSVAQFCIVPLEGLMRLGLRRVAKGSPQSYPQLLWISCFPESPAGYRRSNRGRARRIGLALACSGR